MADREPEGNILLEDRVFLNREVVKEITGRVGVPEFSKKYHLEEDPNFEHFTALIPEIFKGCRRAVFVLNALNAFDAGFPQAFTAMIRRIPETYLAIVYGGPNPETGKHFYILGYLSPPVSKMDKSLKPPSFYP